MLYVNNNGKVLPANAPVIDAGSRAFLYGDGLFESIRIINGKPINLKGHMQRMFKGAELLKIRIPIHLNEDVIKEKILELLELSEITKGGKCRLSLDRMSGGSYKPTSNEATYFIEVWPQDDNEFQLNYKGLEIDIYRDIKLQYSVLSPFKTKNGLIKVMAAIAAGEVVWMILSFRMIKETSSNRPVVIYSS